MLADTGSGDQCEQSDVGADVDHAITRSEILVEEVTLICLKIVTIDFPAEFTVQVKAHFDAGLEIEDERSPSARLFFPPG